MSLDPRNYSKEELVAIGLKAEVERALARLPKGYLDTYSEEKARWLERYIKLNPGGVTSFEKVTVTRRKD